MKLITCKKQANIQVRILEFLEGGGGGGFGLLKKFERILDRFLGRFDFLSALKLFLKKAKGGVCRQLWKVVDQKIARPPPSKLA